MTDLTLQQLVLRFVAYVLIAAVHGLAVAAAACALGDPGPRHDGRLRLNPLAHLDILGTASGVLFGFGWIRPIAVDPGELRLGRSGAVVVVAAGVLATVLAAVVLRLARPLVLPLLPDTAATNGFALVTIYGELSVGFALFNLLPVPPLTGAHLLAAVMPTRRKLIVTAGPYAAVVLAGLAFMGLFAKLLGPAYRTVAALVLGG